MIVPGLASTAFQLTICLVHLCAPPAGMIRYMPRPRNGTGVNLLSDSMPEPVKKVRHVVWCGVVVGSDRHGTALLLLSAMPCRHASRIS